MQETIREYYERDYPGDSISEEIADRTFEELWEWLQENGGSGDIYDFIGVGESMVRESLFRGLSEKLDCDYDEIYELWLHGPRY